VGRCSVQVIGGLAPTDAATRDEPTRDKAGKLLPGSALQAIPPPGQVSAEAHRTALSLALMDLDDFGLVNKHHGHPAGDLVLRTFAALATRSVRDIDCLARYGGEEFCLVAQATCEQLAEMVERIRQEFSEQTIRGHDGAAIRVTFSAGIVDCGDGEPEGLVHQASLALRQAKESGKNRVTVRRPGA